MDGSDREETTDAHAGLHPDVTIGIVTVSDTRNWLTDRSGPAAADALRVIGFGNFEQRIVHDEVEAIQTVIAELSERCQAVFTTGGTGFSPRDVTPEATLPMLDRQANSIVELMRLRGLEHTALSHLSRGVAGVRGRTLIVNLPGSPAGARQGIQAIRALIVPILDSLAER